MSFSSNKNDKSADESNNLAKKEISPVREEEKGKDGVLIGPYFVAPGFYERELKRIREMQEKREELQKIRKERKKEKELKKMGRPVPKEEKKEEDILPASISIEEAQVAYQSGRLFKKPTPNVTVDKTAKVTATFEKKEDVEITVKEEKPSTGTEKTAETEAKPNPTLRCG